jgi:diguanylate cyclase (GGDEF)-like protein/PAS domain S-box-containing protein
MSDHCPDPVQVLLVVRDPGDGERMAALLADQGEPGFVLSRAGCLAEARECILGKAYDVVVTDLDLPDSRGLATVRGLGGRGDYPPVVARTGGEAEALGVEAVRMGAQDLLTEDDLTPARLVRTLLFAMERHQAGRAHHLWSKAFQAGEPMMITDAAGTILGVNAAFTRVTGFPAEEAVGATPALLSSDCHDAGFFGELWRTLREEGSWSGEIWDRRRDGELFPAEETITAVTDRHGRATHYVAILRDVTERKRLEAKLEELATHDRLTGILNRGRLGELLEHELAKSERFGDSLSVILLDIDHFKRINDRLGHAAGDAVLRELTRRLEAGLRRCDRVGRWGGEEFLVLLPRTDGSGASRVAEHIRQTVAGAGFAAGEPVTVSLGVATYRPGENATTLVERADQAVYRAKAAGRNRLDGPPEANNPSAPSP